MTEIVRNIYLLSKIVRIDSVNNLKLRSHIYHHNIRNTTLHTIFHVLFLFICLNFSNKSKIKCETNAAAISGGMSHTMFPVIFVSILLYNLKKMFFSTFYIFMILWVWVDLVINVCPLSVQGPLTQSEPLTPWPY